MSLAVLGRDAVAALRRPRVAIAVALFVAAYVFTRTWLAVTFPYFNDEAIIAWWAEVMDRTVTNALSSLTQGIRPGVPVMTWAVQQLGLNPLDAIRVVSVLWGLALFPVGAALSYLAAGRRAALAFVVLAFLTPYLWLYDVLGNRDIVIATTLAASLLLQIELARRPSLLTGALLGITFALVMTVKDTGKVALVLLPLSLVCFPWRAPDRKRLLTRWALGAAVAYAFAAAAVLVMRTNPAYGELYRIQEGYGAIRPLGEAYRDPLAAVERQFPPVAEAAVAYLTVPVLVLAAMGAVLAFVRRNRTALLALAWAGATFAALMWVNTAFVPRYSLGAVPFVVVLAAYGAAFAWERALLLERRRRVAVAAGVTALALAPAVLLDTRMTFDAADAPYPGRDREQYVEGFGSGYAVEQVAAEIRRRASAAPLRVGIPQSEYSTMRLLLLDEPNVSFVELHDLLDDPTVDLLLINGAPEVVPPEVGRVEPLFVRHRPHGGTPVGLYRRAAA